MWDEQKHRLVYSKENERRKEKQFATYDVWKKLGLKRCDSAYLEWSNYLTNEEKNNQKSNTY